MSRPGLVLVCHNPVHAEHGRPYCLQCCRRSFAEMIERMYVPFCRILSDLMNMDGTVTDVHLDESWVREAKEELLGAALSIQ